MALAQEVSLDYETLRLTKPADVAQYLRKLTAQYSEAALSKALVEAVQEQQITPTIIPTWLSVAHTVTPIKDALIQDFSAFTRLTAAKYVGKRLRGKGWRAMWDGLGGTEGLLEIFSQLPVIDVHRLTAAMGNTSGRRDVDKQLAFTELFNALMAEKLRPMAWKETVFVNSDERNLVRYYFNLLPCCTDEYVKAGLVEDVGWSQVSHGMKQLLTSHTLVVQTLCLQGPTPQIDDIERLVTDIPSRQGDEPGFSAPMSFAWTLLKLVTTTPKELQDVSRFNFPNLIHHLVSQVMAKHIQWKRVAEINQHAIEFYQRHANQRASLSLSQPGFVLDVAKCCANALYRGMAEAQGIFESQLKAVLQLSQYNRPYEGRNGHPSGQLLACFQRRHRYGVLKLVTMDKEGVDISLIEDLEKWKAKAIDCALFRDLPESEAISLLKRLIEAKPDCNFLQNGFDNRPPAPNDGYHDCNLFLIDIYDGSDIGVTLAREHIEARKAKAVKCRDQAERAFYAKSVLWYAVASKSVPLLQEVLIWLQRFGHDLATIRSVYDYQGLCHIPSLLAAIPTDSKHENANISILLGQLETSVNEANRCLSILFETAISSLREPSFASNIWYQVRCLFSDVVDMRLQAVMALSKKFSIPSTSLYEAVWKDTLRLLLDVEIKGLLPGHEALEFNNSCGPLGYRDSLWSSWMPLGPGKSEHSCVQFLESYAQERDNLWSRYRLESNSETAIIPEPFPRGLPIHRLLTGFALPYCCTAPYLRERAKYIAFMKPELANSPLPADKNLKAAIGGFVDSLECAIKVYVGSGDTLEIRARRLEEVWLHWIKVLCTKERMDEKDAAALLHNEVFCFQTFRKVLSKTINLQLVAWPEEVSVLSHGRHPKRPELSMADDVTEWDPAVSEPKPEETLKIDPLLLDCFFTNFHAVTASSKTPFQNPAPRQITKRGTPNFWDPRHLQSDGKHPAGDVREGYLLSLLLYIDDKQATGQRLLAQPFPFSDRVRYPALYLDSSFLEREDLDLDSAFELLRELLKNIPPILLAKLTRIYLDLLSTHEQDSSNLVVISKTALRLLKLLASSDSPQLASNLIIEQILNHPESSSWHRQLLTAQYMRKLTPQSVQDFLLSFVDGISKTMQLQKQARKKRQLDSEQGKKTPYIKVTTLKMLAQLLRNVDFVPESFVISILVQLFKQTEQIDIRLEVVRALHSMWSENTANDTKQIAEQALTALELTIPVISAFNERHPMSEAEWQQAESSLQMPETEIDGRGKAPIFEYLCNAPISEEQQRIFFHRILKPALPLSLRDHQRWLSILCKKHGFDPELSQKIAVPFGDEAYGDIISKYYYYLSETDLNRYQYLVLENLQPSSSLGKISQYFSSSNKLKESLEAKAWSALYGRTSDTVWRNFRLARLLTRAWKDSEVHSTDENKGISIEDVKTCVMQEAHTLIYHPEGVKFNKWNAFINELEPNSWYHNIHSEQPSTIADTHAWLQNTRPIISTLAARIDKLRDQEWQQNPYRNPIILPPTFRLKAWTKRYPFLNPVGTLDQRYQAFATDLLTLLDDSITGPQSVPIQSIDNILQIIRQYPPASSLKIDQSGHLHLAYWFGNFDDNSSNMEFLSITKLSAIHIASQLLLHGIEHGEIKGCEDRDLVRRLKSMVEVGWVGCVVEEVRMMGLKVVEEVGDWGGNTSDGRSAYLLGLLADDRGSGFSGLLADSRGPPGFVFPGGLGRGRGLGLSRGFVRGRSRGRGRGVERGHGRGRGRGRY